MPSSATFIAHNNSSRAAVGSPDTRIDRFTFFGVLFILFAVTLPLIFFPEQGAR